MRQQPQQLQAPQAQQAQGQAAQAAQAAPPPQALHFLDFEQPVAELEAKIEELRRVSANGEINIQAEIARLQKRSNELTRSIFSSLNAWQVLQLARHPLRPYTADYIDGMFTEFTELHGDRSFADDPAMLTGLARFEGRPVAVIGHQKGRDVKERIRRNYGMPKPEGYRKALRVMRLAEKFKLPVLTFIDTPGAFPGIDAEERGQSEAIARNLAAMAGLGAPIIATVIGEGGSGGALAIGVGDRLNMMQYSTYSVISPEGCASILWKEAEKAGEAAEALGITAQRLRRLEVIDQVIEEPLGGAHRDHRQTANAVSAVISRQLGELERIALPELLESRQQRLRSYGYFQ